MDIIKSDKEITEELEEEYERIFRNEILFQSQYSFWNRAKYGSIFLFVLSFIMMAVAQFYFPRSEISMFVLDSSLPSILFTIGIVLYFSAFIFLQWTIRRIGKIRQELGLKTEENLFLISWDLKEDSAAYIREDNKVRKKLIKKYIVKNSKELTSELSKWKTGNIRLVNNLLGESIGLLKNNLSSHVLPSANSEEELTFSNMVKVFFEFCKYIYEPTKEKLDQLNVLISAMPFNENKALTNRNSVVDFLYNNPKVFRILFATAVTSIVLIILYCSTSNVGLAFTVGVTCFWSAFASFDKLFLTK